MKNPPKRSSKVSDNIFFVRSGNYPFAFYLAGVNIDAFKDTCKVMNWLFPGIRAKANIASNA